MYYVEFVTLMTCRDWYYKYSAGVAEFTHAFSAHVHTLNTYIRRETGQLGCASLEDYVECDR